jgi:hypothetical protein
MTTNKKLNNARIQRDSYKYKFRAAVAAIFVVLALFGTTQVKSHHRAEVVENQTALIHKLQKEVTKDSTKAEGNDSALTQELKDIESKLQGLSDQQAQDKAWRDSVDNAHSGK